MMTNKLMATAAACVLGCVLTQAMPEPTGNVLICNCAEPIGRVGAVVTLKAYVVREMTEWQDRDGDGHEEYEAVWWEPAAGHNIRFRAAWSTGAETRFTQAGANGWATTTMRIPYAQAPQKTVTYRAGHAGQVVELWRSDEYGTYTESFWFDNAFTFGRVYVK